MAAASSRAQEAATLASLPWCAGTGDASPPLRTGAAARRRGREEARRNGSCEEAQPIGGSGEWARTRRVDAARRRIWHACILYSGGYLSDGRRRNDDTWILGGFGLLSSTRSSASGATVSGNGVRTGRHDPAAATPLMGSAGL